MRDVPEEPAMVSRPAGTAPLLLDVTEAAAMLGVGRSFVYELLNSGELEYCKLGARTKIPVPAVRAYVERRLAAREEERQVVIDTIERKRRH